MRRSSGGWSVDNNTLAIVPRLEQRPAIWACWATMRRACPVQVVDTTGVEEAFYGGFIYAILFCPHRG